MARTLALLALCVALGRRGVFGSPLEKLAHVVQYERVTPHRVPAALGKRDLSAQLNMYPDHVHYSIRAEGRDYVLRLEKNRGLIGEHYTETYYSENGTEVTERPDTQDHCFYHGHVHGHSDSAASISTCRGLSGFFWADQTVYLIEPLGGDDKGEHAVYRADHLRVKRGTCGDANVTLEYDHEPKVAAAMKSHHWKSAPFQKGTRYVELVLVVDNAEYKKSKDMRMIQNRMKEIVNHVDKLYQTLNIRVALIGLEVWNYKDRITVSPNPDTTLDNFLHWRETELLQKKKHDNAQLITGIDFQGTTVGLAKKYAMCTRDSGGVNQDHSLNPIGAASTVAHEMGHNLGMSHDEDVVGCSCLAPKTDGGCVMAASVGMIYPKYFSSCSVSDLQKFLSDPRTSCLLNIPKADELYGVPVCGNQFVERGEQCDCGTPKECRDPCCNATTCRLSDGAECAQGECCQRCKVKAAGVLCRASKNSCDLPEHCTGFSAECPEDVFQENGVPCQYGNGYCYNGVCPSHSEHCRTLWGAEAQVAPDICFEYNGRQKDYLHCLTENGKRPCSPKDVKCGTLHCLSGNRTPIGGGGVYSLSLGGVTCKAAVTDKEETDVVANLALVPTGTKCGEEMVCYAGRCQDLLIYGAKNCSAKCNGHGVCNHKRKCHCEPGWAAPYCERKLSEIASGGSNVVVAAVLTVVVLVAMLTIGGFVFYKGNGKKYFQKGRIVTTTTTKGLSNPLFQEGSNTRNMRHGLQSCDISSPNLITTTSDLKSPRSVYVPMTPSRPPPEPPAVASSACLSSLAYPAKPVQVGVKPSVAPPPLVSAKPKPAAGEMKPKPPTRPLPELRSKQCKADKLNGYSMEGTKLSALPILPAKPTALMCQSSQPQAASLKVALKPPASRR
ncbi:disintegrin and metalloproteinase domain-containing protein 8 isoform X2 [Dermochelys coriacea]|uniref:disintegrin and metalloproteinase domain-containing protein 8 isoform X2 n=1 Tax=Dermochelys coriacea TaxID=27794 RepID=UPI0018E875D6|nr:disintegrin and metalloproteinase domain-containing protein 8 isoform X2 [Dermochelys coriacea]